MTTDTTALRYAHLDSERIRQISDMLPNQPQGFGVPYHRRDVWEELARRTSFQNAITDAEALFVQEFSQWNTSTYLDYFVTGDRGRGQAMIESRDAWLSPLVWAECLENRGRFTECLAAIILDYCRQPSWVLPAHDYQRENIDGRKCWVDLRAALFTHELAQALYFLDDKLPVNVRQFALDTLDKRIFGPVRESLLSGDGHFWLTIENNWNAVCFSGVVGAALTILPEKQDRAVFAAAGEYYSRFSLSGYTDDGYCPEGLGYWNYGFSHHILLREILLQATGGRCDIFVDAKLRHIALFGILSEVMPGVYPAIADCRLDAKPDAGILWYTSRIFGLGLTQYEQLDMARPGNIVLDGMRTFPNSAAVSPTSKTTYTPNEVRTYFDKAGVLICRPQQALACRLGVVLKGGHNGESHNHNDLGSFSIYQGSEMLIGDPGGPVMYDSKSFSAERYDCWRFNSYGHPVPLVGGQLQREGKSAIARVVLAEFNETCDMFSLDLTAAYSVQSLSRLVRTFTYSREESGKVVVEDSFTFSQPTVYEFALITLGSWSVETDETLLITNNGETIRVTITASSCRYTINAEALDEHTTRIGIQLPDPALSGCIGITCECVHPQ